MAQFTRRLAGGAVNSRLLPYDAKEWDAASGIAENCATRILDRSFTGRSQGRAHCRALRDRHGRRRSLWIDSVSAEKAISRLRRFLWATVWLIGNELRMPALGMIHQDDHAPGKRQGRSDGILLLV